MELFNNILYIIFYNPFLTNYSLFLFVIVIIFSYLYNMINAVVIFRIVDNVKTNKVIGIASEIDAIRYCEDTNSYYTSFADMPEQRKSDNIWFIVDNMDLNADL
jgi:hypothetical protein